LPIVPIFYDITVSMTLLKVRAVKPLGGHKLRFEFSDGSQGERDFADFLCKDGAASRRGLFRAGVPPARRAHLAEWI